MGAVKHLAYFLYKLSETNLGLQVGGAFELNNLVDLSLDGLGYHRKSQSKATIEQLLESWIDLANQAMRHEDGLLRHGCHSVNEEAIELLENLGLIEEVEPEVWRWVENWKNYWTVKT